MYLTKTYSYMQYQNECWEWYSCSNKLALKSDAETVIEHICRITNHLNLSCKQICLISFHCARPPQIQTFKPGMPLVSGYALASERSMGGRFMKPTINTIQGKTSDNQMKLWSSENIREFPDFKHSTFLFSFPGNFGKLQPFRLSM